MPFSDALRKLVLEKAHFHCCICQNTSLSIEVHHIIPQASGGSDLESNAAPMCSLCHSEYGDNPLKRRAITERRDFWYAFCKKREPPKESWIEMTDRLDRTATQEDLRNFGQSLVSEIWSIIGQTSKPTYQIVRELGTFTGTIGSGTSHNRPGCPQCHQDTLRPEHGVLNMAVCRICQWTGPVDENGNPTN